jgi:hypothetical protein
MRQLSTVLMVGGLLASVGCNTWLKGGGGTVADNTPVTDAQAPSKTQLVEYLNVCSSRLNSVQSTNVYMDCKAKGDSGSLDASLVCEKPRNFRMRGRLTGQTVCDIGSNNDEFWYWIKQDKPYVYHCSYDAMARGGVRLPFPFQPDMVVAALGMGSYDPDPNHYELKVLKNSMELSEAITSPQGAPAQRVTVFARGKADVYGGRPQVTEYALRDGQGHDICKAVVERVAVRGSAIVPQKVRLSWPAEKMELALTLNTITINNVDQQFAQGVFNRADLRNYQSFDLGRNALDGGSPAIERVRGSQQ